MKWISILTLFITFSINAFSQRILKQTTPTLALEEVFRAARTMNYDALHLLCDPEQRNDGDTKRICHMKESSKKEQLEFCRFFKLAYPLKVKITAGQHAEVAFKFGPKAQQSETMRLVKRNNKWYLSGF